MSLAKQNFSSASEEALNLQISTELQASHIYMSLAAYFARDNVALPGLAKFFLNSSAEERDHATQMMNYMNERGGQVRLQGLKAPEVEWSSAKNAVEFVLNLEKDVNKSILHLTSVAEEQNDPQMADWLTSIFLSEQVKSISELSHMITQLNRVGGDGLGLYLWDQNLLHHLEGQK